MRKILNRLVSVYLLWACLVNVVGGDADVEQDFDKLADLSAIDLPVEIARGVSEEEAQEIVAELQDYDAGVVK